MDHEATLYAGIDGGGSKCSAILFNSNGEIVAKGLAGSANAARDLPKTLNSIVTSIDARLGHNPASVVSHPRLVEEIREFRGVLGVGLTDVSDRVYLWACSNRCSILPA